MSEPRPDLHRHIMDQDAQIRDLTARLASAEAASYCKIHNRHGGGCFYCANAVSEYEKVAAECDTLRTRLAEAEQELAWVKPDYATTLEVLNETRAEFARHMEQWNDMRDRLTAAEQRGRAQHATPHEIRRNDDGSVDEVVGAGLMHVEQMSAGHWWIGFDTSDGRLLHLNFHAKGRITLGVEDQGPGALSAPPPGA